MKHIIFLITLLIFSCILSCKGYSQIKNDFKIVVQKYGKNKKALFKTIKGKEYPVATSPSKGDKITQGLKKILNDSFCAETIILNQMIKNFLINTKSDELDKLTLQQLKTPTFVFMSPNEGGFAKKGFVLSDKGKEIDYSTVWYVDLVVNKRTLKSGNTEVIFPHEMGHVMMHNLVKVRDPYHSTKMHMTMTVTDYKTAFREGHGVHFQPIAVNLSKSQSLINYREHDYSFDFNITWHSSYDKYFREFISPHNGLIYRKNYDSFALSKIKDRDELYDFYLDWVTNGYYQHDNLKNAQEMMASEGVIATLYYRIATNKVLQNNYLNRNFYAKFYPNRKIPKGKKIKELISGYQNINLKMFHVFNKHMNKRPQTKPHFIHFVDSYLKEFPKDKKTMSMLFVTTTRGVTVDASMRKLYNEAAYFGRIGKREKYWPKIRKVFKKIKELATNIEKEKIKIDANVGPEIWLYNEKFLISKAVWRSKERTLPFTFNLNTASVVELMTVPGINYNIAKTIISVRDRKSYFRSVDDLKEINGITNNLFDKIKKMQDRFDKEI